MDKDEDRGCQLCGEPDLYVDRHGYRLCENCYHRDPDIKRDVREQDRADHEDDFRRAGL